MIVKNNVTPFKQITSVTHRNTPILTGKGPLWQPQKPNLLPENQERGNQDIALRGATTAKSISSTGR